jgi:Glycosyltransferase family 87
MINVDTNRQVDLRSWLIAWLERPISVWWCAAGWCAATALFLGIVAVLGGPSTIDRPESIYGTWAVAHGQLACAYPSVSLPKYPAVAPLYLLLSGGIAAIAHVGHSVPFPSAAVLGPGCDKTFLAMNSWSVNAGALGPTAWIGCVGWLALMVGVVAWLRASGRGRCGWEPATLVMVACLPPVWMCFQLVFHPQDLLALGLALCAMACVRRGRWVGAGILIALAVLSQQFALLVAAPLLVFRSS